MTRTQLEALVWERTHSDFRCIVDGVRCVLHLNPETGGTELWPLSETLPSEPTGPEPECPFHDAGNTGPCNHCER